MPEIITGNLLEATEQYIAHQCNCISDYAAGLAGAIFEKFPYSDCYSDRSHYDVPGTIQICGNGQDQRYVINMFAQYYPGHPKYLTSRKDGTLAREAFFSLCLDEISQIQNLESIAFPWHIGCNLGGGTWVNYLNMLTIFENTVKDSGVNVKIYRRPEDE